MGEKKRGIRHKNGGQAVESGKRRSAKRGNQKLKAGRSAERKAESEGKLISHSRKGIV